MSTNEPGTYRECTLLSCSSQHSEGTEKGQRQDQKEYPSLTAENNVSQSPPLTHVFFSITFFNKMPVLYRFSLLFLLIGTVTLEQVQAVIDFCNPTATFDFQMLGIIICSDDN